MDAIQTLCDIERRLKAVIADIPVNDTPTDHVERLTAITKEINALIGPATLTIEALNPIFGAEDSGRATDGLTLADIAFTAWQHGRNGMPRDREADRCDWFNDTWPLVQAGIEKIKASCIEKMEYARKHQPADKVDIPTDAMMYAAVSAAQAAKLDNEGKPGHVLVRAVWEAMFPIYQRARA